MKVLGGNDPNWIQFFAAGLTTFEYTVPVIPGEPP